MEHTRLVRLAPSRALKEKRLQTLLGGRGEGDARLREVLEEEQVVGSLALSGIAATAAEVRAARRGEPAPPAVRGLVTAIRAVEPNAPLTMAALTRWHAAVVDRGGRFRDADRAREGGPPAAPAPFVSSRLENLEHWLQVESTRELQPPRLGALALARIVEILPFADGNGRVARLAASHLMARAGARVPILVAADEPRLRQALQAAFQLHTEPLATLLDEASERSLDAMIRALEPGSS